MPAKRRGRGEGAVYKDARGYWTGTVELPSHDGVRRRKVVRRKNKRELMTELTALKTELAARGDLPTNTQTCEQWFTYWVEQVAAREVRPNTLDGYRRAIANHIIPAIGRVKLDKLTAAHVRRVHDNITDKGLSSTTALLAHRVMTVSLKAATREGRIGRNPATLTAAPRRARPQLEAFTLDDALRFIEHTLTHDPHGPMWATALLTGARRGEVIGLERDRVTDVLDLSWQMIRIAWEHGCGGACHVVRAASCPQRVMANVPADYETRHVEGGLYWTRPKSSKSWRIIPLLDPLKSILERHLAAQEPNPWGLVFLNNGRPISPDQASRDWRTAVTAAGIDKDVRLHDARHTTVDLLYAAGVPEDLVQELVGHSTRAMTRSYKSLQSRDRLMGAMEQFTAMLNHPRPELEPPKETT